MLAEIRYDKFISYDTPRPPITFHNGLNVVLGTESGSNSIGKSTFLLIVDFTFGGDDYVLRSTDVQTQIGIHTICFSFVFNNEKHYFSRSTDDHTSVSHCDENYNETSKMTIKEYRGFLFEQYKITLPLISFRDIVGRYFRIYGRENLDEKRPLHNANNEPEKDAITALMKLFDTYAAISELEKTTSIKKEEKRRMQKHRSFISCRRLTNGNSWIMKNGSRTCKVSFHAYKRIVVIN